MITVIAVSSRERKDAADLPAEDTLIKKKRITELRKRIDKQVEALGGSTVAKKMTRQLNAMS